VSPGQIKRVISQPYFWTGMDSKALTAGLRSDIMVLTSGRYPAYVLSRHEG